MLLLYHMYCRRLYFIFLPPGFHIGKSTNTEYYSGVLVIYMLLLIQHSRVRVIYSLPQKDYKLCGTRTHGS